MLNGIDIGIDEVFPFYIFDEMITNKQNIRTLDAWLPSDEKDYSKVYNLGIKENVTIYENLKFYIVHKKGGGAGMGAYPPVITIFILHNFKEN